MSGVKSVFLGLMLS